MAAKRTGFTQSEIDELRDVFELFDEDGSGAISAEELGKILRRLKMRFKKEQLVTMIDKVDTDGNGEIDFEEFIEMMEGHGQFDDEVDELEEAFKVFDANGDGTISAQELGQIMTALGQKVDADTLARMVKVVDADGDECIDLEEFRKLMQEGPGTL